MATRRPLVIIGQQIERLPTGDSVNLGKLNIGPPELLTVVLGEITISSSHVEVTSGSNTNLLTINGGEDYDILLLHGQIGTSRVRVNTGGNIIVPAKRDIEGPGQAIMLLKEGALWYGISWSG